MGKRAANLFHGLARAPVVLAHMKPDNFSPLECVIEHELLHFPIRCAAPMTPGQEREADGYFRLGWIPVVVTG